MLSIIKTRENKHLTQKDRDIILKLRSEGKNFKYIAEIVQKDKSTISRELKRNKSETGEYLPSIANKKYLERRTNAFKGKKIKCIETRTIILDKLKEGWSPEQISGWLNKEYPHLYVCTETIYNWIYDLNTKEHYGDLTVYLARKRKRRFHKGFGRKQQKSNILNKKSIEERPKEVDERKRVGDWETDSIVSRESSAALNTLVERKSGLILISKLKNKTSEQTRKIQIKRLKIFPAHLIKTITADNGGEHAEHEFVAKILGLLFYFANPYHSWERGVNENANGLVRRYFPKGTDFSKITEEEIKQVEHKINSRPRKRFGFKTPYEVFYELTGFNPLAA